MRNKTGKIKREQTWQNLIWYISLISGTVPENSGRMVTLFKCQIPIFNQHRGFTIFQQFLKVIGVHRVLMGKPEGKTPLGRPRRRWKDNIQRDIQDVGGGCGDWMERAQDRDRWRALVSTVMNCGVP
jgi:hypothetical protein